MGDNAKAAWEWHNLEVGKGYQARGVIRQPGSSAPISVIDMSKPTASKDDSTNTKSRRDEDKGRSKSSKEKKEKEREKEKEAKKSHKEIKHSRKAQKTRFNPLLQLLATRLSDKTMSFQ